MKKDFTVSLKNDVIYQIHEKLGSGSFGAVYLIENTENKKLYAVKVEDNEFVKKPVLSHEYQVYRRLSGGKGIPKVFWFFREEDYKWMCMQRLGISVNKWFDYCNQKFSLQTVLLIADQLISRLEYMHQKCFLHRDLKPSNFVFGHNDDRCLYLIDFGLAKSFISEYNGKHIPRQEGRKFVGTARFASINSHLGYSLSRRDDFESLGYCLIYLLKGKLPWQSCTASNKKDKMDKILKVKATTSLHDLCRDTPFYSWMKHIWQLKYEEAPDYAYLRKLIRNIFFSHSFANDNRYDWEIMKDTNRVIACVLLFQFRLWNPYLDNSEKSIIHTIQTYL